MLIVELREAIYNKAFDLMDEVKEHGKATKMAICALEDALYECYEASKDEWEREDYSEDPENYDEKSEMKLRRYRRNMRNNEDMINNDMDYSMRSNRHTGMRMRRNRIGMAA